MGYFNIALNMTAPGSSTGVGVATGRNLTVAIAATGDGVADWEVSHDNNTWFTPANRVQLDTISGGSLWVLRDTPVVGIRATVSSITTGRVDVTGVVQ